VRQLNKLKNIKSRIFKDLKSILDRFLKHAITLEIKALWLSSEEIDSLNLCLKTHSN
jgi:hypothetical protein